METICVIISEESFFQNGSMCSAIELFYFFVIKKINLEQHDKRFMIYV